MKHNQAITTRRSHVWWMAAILALAGLGCFSSAWAHGGYEHVMGVVQSVADNSVTVKTTAGKVVEVRLDEKTTYLRGTQTQQKSDMKVGDRVVIDATKTGNTLVAHQIKLGTAAKKTATSTGSAAK